MSIGEDRQIHIRLPKELYTKLKVRCAYGETSIQDFIVSLVRSSMDGRRDRWPSILIVEDEEILRDSLRDSLSDAHDVEAVGSGEDALALVKDRNFDVVLTDVRLPGMSGVELIRLIKESKPPVVCVVITAYPSVELAVDAMKQGAFDYLVKPVTADALERVFDKISAISLAYK